MRDEQDFRTHPVQLFHIINEKTWDPERLGDRSITDTISGCPADRGEHLPGCQIFGVLRENYALLMSADLVPWLWKKFQKENQN